MPTQGTDRKVYLETKFGSLTVFHEMEQRLLEAGREEQIVFAFDKIARTPNTFLAHRLIWYAGVQGRQDAVVDSLFKGFFEEGADIGSSDVLMQLAERADLKAEAFLLSNEGTTDVQSEETVSRRLGIRSVPYFVLNRTHGVSGAQPAEVFVAAIEKIGMPESGASTEKR
jgi:predicted DsbA family dithiol-disulfide isomerase